MAGKNNDEDIHILRAARAGNLKEVLHCLEEGIDINSSNPHGLTALHLASKEGWLDIVAELIKRGANVNAATKKGNTPLHIACLSCHENIVNFLIHNGAKVNVQSEAGFTPLYMASQNGNVNIVACLLANKADHMLSTADGFTPLAVALQQENNDVVTLLIENDKKQDHAPALQVAAKKGDTESVNQLLQNEPDTVNNTDKNDEDIRIVRAARAGNLKEVLHCLEEGIDINSSNRHGLTALHLASKEGWLDIVAELIKRGASVNAATKKGNIPLHLACLSCHENIVNFLIHNGAKVNVQSEDGFTPLYMASQNGNVNIVACLLANKADHMLSTIDGFTPLNVALQQGHEDVVTLITEHDKEQDHAPALHIAAKKGDTESVKKLLQNEPDTVNNTDKEGNTALHLASMAGRINVVKLLVENGANVNVKAKTGFTPLYLASQEGQTEVVRYLMANGADQTIATTEPVSDPEYAALTDRVLATIYGQCVGDAIGLLTEFLTKEESKKYYGSVCKQLEFTHKAIVGDMHRIRWAEGDWTDDSDQMILILRSLLDNNGKAVPTDFAKKLKQWTQKGFPELGDYGGMGIGRTTITVVNNPKYTEDPHAAAHLVWDSSGRDIAPNGGVMRTSIVGIHNYQDLEQVYDNALAFVKTTHADHRCQASAVAVSVAIAMMLQRHPTHLDKKGKYDIKKLIDDVFGYAARCLQTDEQKKELKTYLKCKSIKDLKLDEPGKIGYTYKSMGSGFWALKQDDFRKAIQNITMEGGDADSNACVAGALLGCKLGLSELPISWTSKLKHKQWLDAQIQRYFDMVGWRKSQAASS